MNKIIVTLLIIICFTFSTVLAQNIIFSQAMGIINNIPINIEGIIGYEPPAPPPVDPSEPPTPPPIDPNEPPTPPINPETPKGLVFLHGFGMNDTSMDSLKQKIIEDRWLLPPENFYSYTRTNSGRNSMAEQTAELSNQLGTIQNNNFTKPILIGFSAGGVVATDYAKNYAKSNTLIAPITGIITIDSPLKGFDLLSESYILQLSNEIGKRCYLATLANRTSRLLEKHDAVAVFFTSTIAASAIASVTYTKLIENSTVDPETDKLLFLKYSYLCLLGAYAVEFSEMALNNIANEYFRVGMNPFSACLWTLLVYSAIKNLPIIKNQIDQYSNFPAVDDLKAGSNYITNLQTDTAEYLEVSDFPTEKEKISYGAIASSNYQSIEDYIIQSIQSIGIPYAITSGYCLINAIISSLFFHNSSLYYYLLAAMYATSAIQFTGIPNIYSHPVKAAFDLLGKSDGFIKYDSQYLDLFKKKQEDDGYNKYRLGVKENKIASHSSVTTPVKDLEDNRQPYVITRNLVANMLHDMPNSGMKLVEKHPEE